VLVSTILLLGFGRTWTENAGSTHAGRRIQVKMNTVAGSRKEKESGLAPTFLAGTKWPVEKPEIRPLGEWIEFGRELRSASDEEILSLISSVVIYLKDQLKDETFPSTDYNYREYVRGYANTILKAAQDEHAKRHSERLG
jgi:hypothetical protein